MLEEEVAIAEHVKVSYKISAGSALMLFGTPDLSYVVLVGKKASVVTWTSRSDNVETIYYVVVARVVVVQIIPIVVVVD